MKKKFILIMMSFVLLLTLTSGTVIADSNEIEVILDGKQLTFDTKPITINGTTLVPMRPIFEAMEAEVKWDNATQIVTAKKDGTTVKLTISQKTAYKNGTMISLSSPGKIVNGSTMVPLRFVGEAFGATVKWDNVNQLITITTNAEITYDVTLKFPSDRYPETAAHISAAITKGKSAICTIDRDGADENREESLKGIPTKDGYDRDEWPMAMCSEGGQGADVAYVESSDNRGAGSWVGNALEEYPNGTRVLFIIDNGISEENHNIPKEQENKETESSESKETKEVFYKNCTAVREAGAAPLYAGDPGYSRSLDRDGDGVACE